MKAIKNLLSSYGFRRELKKAWSAQELDLARCPPLSSLLSDGTSWSLLFPGSHVQHLDSFRTERIFRFSGHQAYVELRGTSRDNKFESEIYLCSEEKLTPESDGVYLFDRLSEVPSLSESEFIPLKEIVQDRARRLSRVAILKFRSARIFVFTEKHREGELAQWMRFSRAFNDLF